MAEDNRSSPLSLSHSGSKIPTRHTRPPTSRSAQSYTSSYGSYETGESSGHGRTSHDTFSGDTTIDPPSQPEHRRDETDGAATTRHAHRNASEDRARRHRAHKPRSTGGFLLSNPVYDEPPPNPYGGLHEDGPYRSRIPVDSHRGKSPSGGSYDRAASDPHHLHPDMGIGSRDMMLHRHARPPLPSKIPSPRLHPNPLDVESSQIVNMALNLSESRRMAQRRNISSPLPPRLAPMPDSPAGGSLKQHLQQQRRTSRNISPIPDRGLGPRTASGAAKSPLQPSYEPDSNYKYHFSTSTLNRTQQAKEHFELMAQYIRLLQALPPLKASQDVAGRSSISSPPASPTASSAVNPFSSQHPRGRLYNPLQYIRNRKVRARARRTIDGEAQGFADVDKVSEWVDQAAGMAATHQQAGAPVLPPFQSCEQFEAQQILPSSQIPVPVQGVSKLKRPRMDWVIDPADMLADTYWLEQDDNKSLIEDRNYARIFPPNQNTGSRPMSQSTNEPAATASITGMLPVPKPSEANEASVEQKASDSNRASKADTEGSHVSTRERARQKLHELRGMHHKHASSVHSHHSDFLGLRKGSLSDFSDSDSDRKREERRGSEAPGKALLEKQINEMLAKEAMTSQKEDLSDAGTAPEPAFRPTLMTPERASEPSSRGHSRKQSRVYDSDVSERAMRGRTRRLSPPRSGRASLEVPGSNPRTSLDLDLSLPSSPDLKASTGGYMPTIGMDLSPPSSRPQSPMRNPFSKVKSMLRDRSRERGQSRASNERDSTNVDSPIDRVGQVTLPPIMAGEVAPSDRRGSDSPAPLKLKPRPSHEHRMHRSAGSLRMGRDEQVGLRTILKGAKIDDIIRGGVSKMSDLLWKKDDGNSTSTSTSSDDSDVEPRGRPRASTTASRASSRLRPDAPSGTNFLDIMPAFKSTSELEKSKAQDNGSLTVPVNISRPPSRSSRFDKLKPPKIDVRSASPKPSPIQETNLQPVRDSDISDVDTRLRDSQVSTDAARRSSAQLNARLSLASSPGRGKRDSLAKPRPWHISDRSPSPLPRSVISKREVARQRALVLATGITAMEISRRATEPHPLFALDNSNVGIPWTDVSAFIPLEKANVSVSQTDLYSTAARILASSIESSGLQLSQQAQSFAQEDMRQLRSKVAAIHQHVATDLIDMTRRAADDADECSRDIVDTQRLKVNRTVDIIDTMLRRRRRRFRWVRRAGWMGVEWVLVGFMWYVWFVVTIVRVVLGIGRGAVGVVRWLLWI